MMYDNDNDKCLFIVGYYLQKNTSLDKLLSDIKTTNSIYVDVDVA